MKKLISLLLICNTLFIQSMPVFADTPLLETSGAVNTDNIAEKPQFNGIPKESSDMNKTSSEKNVMPNKIVEKFPNEGKMEEYQGDSEEDYKPSKWEMAKNVAIYLGKSFVNDVKSYVKSYPLQKIAQTISFCLWYFPAYALYKKTGIDIPAKLSSYITSENAAIFARNIYNVIPMTLTSFLYKWGREAFAYMKR